MFVNNDVFSKHFAKHVDNGLHLNNDESSLLYYSFIYSKFAD